MKAGQKNMDVCPCCGADSFSLCEHDPPPHSRLTTCRRCGLLRARSLQHHTVRRNIWSGERSFFGGSFAVEYTKGEAWRRRIARHRLDRIEKKIPKGRILDMGCATGLFLNEAAERGWDAFGVDISSDAVAYGGLHFPRILLRLGSCEQLAFWEDRFFDVITCFDTLGYVDDPRSVLQEFARLLRPMGLLFMTNVYPERVSENPKGLFNYYFPKETLHRTLESAGFTEIESRVESKDLNLQKAFTWGWVRHRFHPLNRKDVRMTYTEARSGRLWRMT